MNPLLPDPDPSGLPAPVSLLKLLLVFTFILHLLPMNLILGGGFVAGWAAWRGRRGVGSSPLPALMRWRALAGDLARLLPVSTAFAITFGVAPLLFLQVLYGQLFYTSSVLMAWSWLAVIGLLLVGYYAYYGFSFGHGEAEGRAAAWAIVGASCLSLVALVFTNNMTLMLRAEAFAALYAADERGLHLNLADPVLWPRFLHFLIASFALTGLVVAARGRQRARADAETGTWMQALGLRFFVGATLLQMASGLWFLFALPETVKRLFLGGSPVDTTLLWAAVAFAVLSLVTVKRSLGAGSAAIGLTVAGMAMVRHRVREATLAPHFSADSLATNSQTALLLLFLALLLLGLGIVGWMLRQLVSARPRTRPTP